MRLRLAIEGNLLRLPHREEQTALIIMESANFQEGTNFFRNKLRKLITIKLKWQYCRMSTGTGKISHKHEKMSTKKGLKN